MLTASKQFLLLVACCFLTVAMPLHAGDQPASCPYFPTDVGSEWVFKSGNIEVRERVTKHEEIDGEVCVRIETLLGERVVSFEHIAVREDGIYRVAIAGKKLEPAFCFFRLPVQIGDKWTAETAVGERSIRGEFSTGASQVRVPAGSFETISTAGRNFTIEGIKFDYYFAEDVGKVKQAVMFGENRAVLELVSYHIGNQSVQRNSSSNSRRR